MNLTFDSQSHTYEMDGRPVPSVSKIIQPAKPWMPEGPALEAARERGHRIHEYAEELNNGFEPDVLPEDELYIAGYRKFLGDFKPKVLFSEVRVGHVTYKYAGTCDLIAGIDGGVGPIDYKTGQIGRWDKLQLSGYEGAAVNMGLIPRADFRATLWLPGTGDYRFIEHKDHTGDWVTFLAYLTILQWEGKNP